MAGFVLAASARVHRSPLLPEFSPESVDRGAPKALFPRFFDLEPQQIDLEKRKHLLF
jgi:hypothetical protein